MTDFGRIVRNAGWNLLGTFLPLLSAVFAIPFLIERLGVDRFGLLALVWVLIGYFSFFDLGLGRALTKWVAELAGQKRETDVSSVCSTGIAAVSLLGGVGSLLLLLASPLLVEKHLSHLDDLIRAEAAGSLVVVAAAIPLVVVTSALRGVLEGFERFRLLNLIRTPTGILLFIAPCLSAFYSTSLIWAVTSLLLARLLVLIAYLLPCLALVKLHVGSIDRKWVSPMLRFGGWLSVSNTVGPVIVYADRFVIVSMISAAALTYYSAPFEVVSRLLLLPTALTAALFPALSSMQVERASLARDLRRRATSLVLAVVAPIVVIGIALAESLLALWLGTAFAENGTVVMQILLVGFLFNALAQVPFSALHSYGLAKQPALLHLVELPLYLVILVALVPVGGLEAAAVAWSVRALFDFVMMSLLLRHQENRLRGFS